MNDRQPTPGKEGRVKLTFEDGSIRYAKIEMADDPIEQGDAINKATLWPDNVAEKFGLPTSTLPKDGFSFLGDYNLHWWRKRKLNLTPTELDLSSATGNTIQQAYALSSGSISSQGSEVKYSDTVTIDPETGGVVLSGDVKTIPDLDYDGYTSANVLLGKYVKVGTFNPLYVEPGATIKRGIGSAGGTTYYVWASKISILSVASEPWEYLHDASPDAYPKNTIQEGYEYQYLGVPFANFAGYSKFAVKSYVGNRSEGDDDSAITINVPFYPIAVIINDKAATRGNSIGADGSTIWNDTSIVVRGCNKSGVKYTAIVLGF